MEPFKFGAPTKIISSDNCADSLMEILSGGGYESIGLIIDRSIAATPPVKELITRAEQLCSTVVAVTIEATEPTTETVDEHTSYFKQHLPDFFVGIGGGSTLDLAKAVSVLTFNPGYSKEYQGRDLLPNAGCISAMIPTTAGTGSEVTPGAVVVNTETNRKGAISSPYVTPEYAILDPRLAMSMPRHVAASTGLDALAHAIESYTAAVATPITRMYSLEAFRLIKSSLPKILDPEDRPQDIDLWRNQMLGASLAGVSICNSDTGACHALSYPLGIYFGVPHGVAVSLLLPIILKVNILKGARHYSQLAEELVDELDGATAEEKCHVFQGFVSDLVPAGVLPASLKEFGVGASDLPFLAERGLDLKTALENNPVQFTLADSRQVLEQLL